VSDLQCAATFVFAVPGEPPQARALADDLRSRRVAAVYAGQGAAERTGRLVAGDLGLQVRPEPALHGSEVEARTALEGIADEHRGETVLVAADAPLLGRVLPTLVPGLPASYRAGLGPGDVVELRVDADGWVVDAWADERGSAGGA